MKRGIRIALIGAGNCACVLLQGLKYYEENEKRPGLWHPVVGGYKISDLEVVSAFDINHNKIGLDLSQAIFDESNTSTKLVSLQKMNVKVLPGILKDKLPTPFLKMIRPSIELVEDIADTLKKEDVDIVLNTVSTGMDKSSKAYADASLKAGCCFINATPSCVATSSKMVDKYTQKRLVVVGDDLMSQFGGTVFHKEIIDFMHRRGVKVVKSYQLDVGGGAETLNTIDEDIKEVKRNIKTRAIKVEAPYEFKTVAGTTDYVDYLGSNRTGYFWIQGEGFLGSDVCIDIYLRTNDGPNAGNMLFDVIRAVQAAKETGEYGAPLGICGYGFKRPPSVIKLQEATKTFEKKYLAE